MLKPNPDASYLVECERDGTLYILSAHSANGSRTLYLTEHAAKQIVAALTHVYGDPWKIVEDTNEPA